MNFVCLVQLPRVPTDGLSNIVPPQDPNHVSIKELYTTKENYTAIQTGKISQIFAFIFLMLGTVVNLCY